MTCAEVIRDEVVERYVAGKLDGGELDAFEQHLLGCDRCQDEVRLATAVREALADGASIRDIRRQRAWPWVALAAAATIATLMVMPRLGSESEIARLGRVGQPPIWLGVPVRGEDGANADSLFDAAMIAYDEKQWDDAARGLDAALEAGADSVPTGFFLGAARLMADDAEAAAEALDSVVAAGESPYLVEARYYRAKALLRQERAEPALSDLDAAAQSGGAMNEPARALADSVRSLRKR